MKRLFTRLLLTGAVVSGACTMKDQPAPPLTGPSELGLSITVSVSPDVLPQDGGSQSLVTIKARDERGVPKANVQLRVGMRYGLATVDFGSLSARTLTTGPNGEASLTYTAPPSADSAPDTNAEVTIVVTPIGTDYVNTIERIAVIRLVPPGVVIPGDGLVARFTMTPESPTDNQTVLFDASTSSSNPLSPITSYTWDFGDGATGTGKTAQHAFRNSGTFAVTLTIADAFGRSRSTVQSVTVAPGLNPTASIIVSPAAPLPGQTVNFNGSASVAAPGRTISRFDWDFGDGSSASGQQVSHAYAAIGTYTATLVVTDNTGKTATATANVTVGSGTAPTATFVFSPSTPVPNQQVSFNASTSRAATGRTITSYQWNFGDGGTASGVQPSHTYAASGTYNVTLTVTDSQGQTAAVVQSITVAAGTPTAAFTFSPTDPTLPASGTVTVNFNASTSVPATGRTITSYVWDFGDGSAIQTTTTPTVSHPYGTANTFTVTLTVTDDLGRSGTTSKTVTIKPPA